MSSTRGYRSRQSSDLARHTPGFWAGVMRVLGLDFNFEQARYYHKPRIMSQQERMDMVWQSVGDSFHEAMSQTKD